MNFFLVNRENAIVKYKKTVHADFISNISLTGKSFKASKT